MPAPETKSSFASPSALREFALQAVAELRAAGLQEAADRLEDAANYCTSSGWEWLGELRAAAASIQASLALPEGLASSIARLHQTATSERPYG